MIKREKFITFLDLYVIFGRIYLSKMKLYSFVMVILYASVQQVNSEECPVGYFRCSNGKCIREEWICDGDNDCQDWSDEPDDCPPCAITFFQCNNGNCIPATLICNGDNDCGDMSDERDPMTGMCPSCPDTTHQCHTGRCIPKTYVCDGFDDCGDNSDEPKDPDKCPACSPTEFRCSNGRCIWIGFVCNELDNCGDNSDEPEDPDQCPACKAGQWRCLDGSCISEIFTCDGYNDCGDWSDETEDACPCSDDEFRCKKLSEGGPAAACIPLEWVCDEDGIWDCPGGDDEANCTSITWSKIIPRRIDRPTYSHVQDQVKK